MSANWERQKTGFTITGLDGICDRLKELPAKMVVAAERRILKRALQPVLEKAKANTPRGPARSIRGNREYQGGNLQNGWTAEGNPIRTWKYQGRVFGAVINTAQHVHLVEMGHRMVTHKPEKRFLGFRTRAHSFMRPALYGQGEMIFNMVGEDIWKEIEKMEKRTGIG